MLLLGYDRLLCFLIEGRLDVEGRRGVECREIVGESRIGRDGGIKGVPNKGWGAREVSLGAGTLCTGTGPLRVDRYEWECLRVARENG